MHDVWFGPGLTPDDWEGFLKALSLQGKPHTPLLAVANGDDEATLVLASRALFAVFGVTTSAGLARRLIGGNDPGAKRLAILFRTLPLEGAPRLERLRFFVGPGSEIITFLCRRVTMAGGQLVFIAAALGIRPELLPAPEAPRLSFVAPPPDEAPIDVPRAVSVSPPIPPAPRTLEEATADARTLWPANKVVRFLWRTDANGFCTFVAPQLGDVVGQAHADLLGRDLAELAPAIDPSGRLAEALGRRTTWSVPEIAWPLDAAAGVATSIGAVPAFERDGAFAGYRGYGLIHPQRILARAFARFAPRQSASTDDTSPSAALSPRLSATDRIAFDALGAELLEQTKSARRAPDVSAEREIEHIAPHADTTPKDLAPEDLAPEDLAPEDLAPEDLAPEDLAPDDRAHPAPEPVEQHVPSPGLPHIGIIRTEEIARNGLAMLDSLSVGLLVSRDNVPIFANRHLLDLLGCADEDALHAAGGMERVFEGQATPHAESQAIGIRDRDGGIVPANARIQRIDWDGLPATLLTLSKSVPSAASASTHGADKPMPRHEAAYAPGDDARELRAILETATDGVVVIDSRCDILSLNRSAEALLGCDRAAVVGKPFADLFASANQGLVADYIDGLKSNAMKSLLNDGREFLVKAAQGGTIPVFMTLGRLAPSIDPSSNAPSGTAHFCALFRDLTHWKKVEKDLESAKQEAERASALKSDFLAKVSHEVRTPLNAIIGFAEVIIEERFGPVGNERYKDYLRDIHASGTHVMSLVNDLLDLSKIEAGKMNLTITAVDANKIIGECVATMQPQASRERVIMRLSLAPGLRPVKADERSLRQIVLNLLSNAVKFNEPGGQVIVATATSEDGRILIRIRDTGPGMSEADIAAALEPFRQLSTSRSTTGGTGLGLPLTKALVEANHASFTIRSKIDHGTLVEVAFPTARALAG